MNHTQTQIDLDAVMKQAHQLRADAMADVFAKASKKLSAVFVSELRLTRESALARLQAA